MDEVVAYRERVGANVTKKLARAIGDGTVTRGEAAKIARYVLDNLDKASTGAEVFNFLSTLSEKWPLFKDEFAEIKDEQQRTENAYSSDEVTDLIKRNKIEEALKMAEESSNNSEQ